MSANKIEEFYYYYIVVSIASVFAYRSYSLDPFSTFFFSLLLVCLYGVVAVFLLPLCVTKEEATRQENRPETTTKTRDDRGKALSHTQAGTKRSFTSRDGKGH